MAQTAVEWLVQELTVVYPRIQEMNLLTDKARHMEKEQIMKAVDRGFDEGCKHPEDITLKDAEQYYNETFGK
jgi:hypothetical protein